MSPPIPRPKQPPHADYEVCGPFILVRGSTEVPVLHLWDLTFEQAIEEFVRYGCPPALTYSGCGVFDRDGVCVVGWYQDRKGGFVWNGVRAALAVMRTFEILPQLMLLDVELAVLG